MRDDDKALAVGRRLSCHLKGSFLHRGSLSYGVVCVCLRDD